MRAFSFVISAGCENHGLARLADDGNAMTVLKKFHIALVGLPGSGKSTIGRYLAKRWSMPFVDVDTAIEEQIQCTIREFFAKEGEEAFRAVEEEVLVRLLAGERKAVIATGGGAVLRRTNRDQLVQHAQHGGQAHTGGEQHHRGGRLGLQEKVPRRRHQRHLVKQNAAERHALNERRARFISSSEKVKAVFSALIR